MDHDIDPTVDNLNAIQRGADLARSIGGEEAGLLYESYIVQSLHEWQTRNELKSVSAPSRLPGNKVSNFITQAPTRIDFVSPSSGTTAGGTNVSISGKSFQPGATVTFGGVAATNVTYFGCSILSAVTPAGVAGPVNVVVTNPDMTGDNLASGFTYTTPAPPGTGITVTAVSPDIGPPSGGTSITITGSGFTAPATVFFQSPVTADSIAATSVVVTNSTTITAVTPPGAGGLSNVRVSAGASSFTLSDAFYYSGANLPAPSISSFTSAALPGSTISIVGSNFVGVTAVRFANKTGIYSRGTTLVTPSVIDSAHLTVVVPVGAGSGPLQVDTVFGTASTCDPFNVLTSGPPTVTGLPPSATWGTVNTFATFTITGTNFQDVQDVEVNGIPIQGWGVSSSTSLVCNFFFLPPSGPVTVRTSGGIGTSAGSLNVVDPEFCAGPVPTITSLPATGAPNTNISIGGTHFCPDGVTHFLGTRFAGERQSVATFVNDDVTPVASIVPASDPGASPIVLITEWGYVVSPTTFTPTAVPAPTFTLGTTTGVRGANLQLTGTNLNGLYEVSVAGQAIGIRGNVIPTSFIAAVPFNIPAGPQVVTASSLSGSPSAAYSVSCGTPTITSFTPAAKIGTSVTISGTNLIRSPGRTLAFFNGVRASLTAASSDTSLVMTVPPGATAGPITVVTGNGTVTSGSTFVPLGRTNSEFDGDGKADILWHNTANGQNYIYRMDGLSITSQDYVNTVPDTAWTIVGTGDFNRDGKTDVLWRNTTTGDNYIYLMNGSTITSSGVINTIADPNWKVAGIGDFDGDGRSDILWRNISTGANYIYFMNGLTITSQIFVNTVPTAWQVAGIGDFNSDQKSDILWRNTSTGENYMYLMNGATIVSYGTVNIIADSNWIVAGVGDFNNDQKADILWHNNATGVNYIYYMNGIRILQQDYVNTVADTNWKVVATGDFNRDGITDILWRNSVSGQNYIYLMNGSAIGANAAINTVADANWKVFE